MSTGYKINKRDIEEIFESFPIDIAEQYHVTMSEFSGASNKFLKEKSSIKINLGRVFPTSAGTYLGGHNKCMFYRVNGDPIDIALKGCRPIGIPLVRLGPGIHYVNRIHEQTWISSLPDSASGTRLEYDPRYFHAEVLGGGGGGGGSATMYASAGGGGGGYCYTTVKIPDNSHICLVVGEKGAGGDARGTGKNGGDSYILDCNGNELCRACGGQGGGTNNDNGGQGGNALGGIVNLGGALGGKKENNGWSIPTRSVALDKPEGDSWERGNTSGGRSNGNNYGGGGGASAFSNGADGNSNTTPSPAQFGAGGAGAGFKALAASNGGDGGEGFINLYY